MKIHGVKQHPTIGCCGIDCGLCPRYYTTGSSRCPGCCGPDFFHKHPSCSHITCCVKKKHLEVCGECNEFPCSKFRSWFGNTAYDSFVTHKKAEPNLQYIRKNGIKDFLKQQEKRMKILNEMLKEFNDGRSKSFYCRSSALLSLRGLENALAAAKKQIKQRGMKTDDTKMKARVLKTFLQKTAKKEDVELGLRVRPETKKRTV